MASNSTQSAQSAMTASDPTQTNREDEAFEESPLVEKIDSTPLSPAKQALNGDNIRKLFLYRADLR